MVKIYFRLIVSFILLINKYNILNQIQGGDPTGTGKGGESYWKSYFPDQIKSTLSHDDRGILSMANRGKDTNGSQL